MRCTVGVFLVVVFFFFITTYCISVCSHALICTQCVRAHKNAALSRHESGGWGVLSLLWMCKKKKTEKSKGQQRKAICLLHLRAKNFLFFVSFLLKEKKETLKKGDVMSSWFQDGQKVSTTVHDLQRLFFCFLFFFECIVSLEAASGCCTCLHICCTLRVAASLCATFEVHWNPR